MTDEQVERVARALARKARVSEMEANGFNGIHLNEYVDACWADHKDRARAAIAALPPQVSLELIEKLGKLANYLTEQGEYEACDLIDTVVERVTKPALPPQGDGWQDIASAPRDGTKLLLWPGYLMSGEPMTGWYARLARKWVAAGEPFGTEPSHWQPLPKPPAPPAAEIERAPKQDGLAELRALTRDLPEKNEEVWAAGMNAIRDMLCDLERDDFKDIGNGYPAAIWAAMYDAAELERTKP